MSVEKQTLSTERSGGKEIHRYDISGQGDLPVIMLDIIPGEKYMAEWHSSHTAREFIGTIISLFADDPFTAELAMFHSSDLNGEEKVKGSIDRILDHDSTSEECTYMEFARDEQSCGITWTKADPLPVVGITCERPELEPLHKLFTETVAEEIGTSAEGDTALQMVDDLIEEAFNFSHSELDSNLN